MDFLVSSVGADKVMLGSDWPFPIGDPEPCKVVKNSSLSADDQARVLERNAQDLFGI